MSVSLVAVDYSRPIQPLFEQPPRVGNIHSVFRQAMNITLDDTILALLSERLPRMPNSVRLPPVVAEELSQNLQPGMEVWVGDGRLVIPAHNFSLQLPQTLAWEPRPEVTKFHWCRGMIAQHVRLLARYLDAQPQQDGLAPLSGPLLLGRTTRETPLSQMALPMLQMLARASWRQDSSGIEEATYGLAGLGPGLTPSGDDALGGFAAVMALLSPQLSADAAPRDHIAAIIAAGAGPRTTGLSAMLLAHAARGEIAEHLGELLLALTLPSDASEAILHIAGRILATGATSGCDSLLGILLGLRALEGELDGVGG